MEIANPSSIFDVEYEKYEVKSTNNEDIFRCCLDPHETRKLEYLTDIEIPEMEYRWEQNCTGDVLTVFVSIKTTPLIWKLLDDENFHYEEIRWFHNIFNDVYGESR